MASFPGSRPIGGRRDHEQRAASLSTAANTTTTVCPSCGILSHTAASPSSQLQLPPPPDSLHTAAARGLNGPGPGGSAAARMLCQHCRTIGGKSAPPPPHPPQQHHPKPAHFVDNNFGAWNVTTDVTIPPPHDLGGTGGGGGFGNFPPSFCTGIIPTCPCLNCHELRMTGRPPLSAPPDFSTPFSHHVTNAALASILSPRGLDSGAPHLRFFPPNAPSPRVPSPPDLDQTCAKHQGLQQTHHCLTCDKFVCSACKHVYHHYHTVRSFIHCQTSPSLADVKNASTIEIELLESAILSASTMEEKIAGARDKVVTDIKQVFKKHQEVLRQKEAALIAQVNAITDLRQDSLSEQVRQIKDHLDHIKSLHEKVEDTNESESMAPVSISTLKSALSITKPTTNPYLFTVLEDDSFILKTEIPRAQQAIKSLCQLTTSAYPPLCMASGEGLSNPHCKESCSITVTTKDRTGTPCVTGGEPLFVELKGPDSTIIELAKVRDHKDGTYSFTFKPFIDGDHVLTVAIHKQHIQASPFHLCVETSRELQSYNIRGADEVFGCEGSKPGQLNRPWGVAVDQDGNVIIGDRSNHRIQVFSIKGELKYMFGSEGIRPGQFNRPAGVAVSREGFIVVADKDNHRVQVLELNGNFRFMFGSKGSNDGQMIYPYDVAVNEIDGRIAVTDTGNHRLLVFNEKGILVAKFGYKGYLCGHFDSPRGIAFCDDGRIVVSDFNIHHILVIQKDGMSAKIYGGQGSGDGQFKRPQGIAIDRHGNFVIVDTRNHRIVIMHPKGQVLTSFGCQGSEPGQFDRPTSVAVSPFGHIVVVDFGNSRIQVF